MYRTQCILLALLFAGPVCRAADLIRSPYLQNVGSNCATVMWTSAQRGTGAVEYSADGDLSRKVLAQVREFAASPISPGFFQYQAELGNLTPGREYLYQVVMDGELVAADLRLRTTAPGVFTFLVLGDSGTGNDDQRAIARRMIDTEDPSFVLHTGDLSQESGTFQQYDDNYFGVYRELMTRTPFFPSPGNHDYYTDSGNPYLSTQAPPPGNEPLPDLGRYYSFDWGNAHFVSLNTNLFEMPGPSANRMLAWLESDLQRQTRFWKVVYFHHPPYATGHHLDDPVCAEVRARLVPILEKYNVQLVLSGHEHSYQRTYPSRAGALTGDDSGTVYVITGGGGGTLHDINRTPLTAVGQSVHHYLRCEVRGASLTVTAIGVNGEVIDKVTLTRPSQVAAESVVNLGSYTPGAAEGSLVSIFGRALAGGERTASTLPYPSQLGGSTVTWNGLPVPLLSVSPYQIKAQLPYGISGAGKLRVSNPDGDADLDLDIAPSAPSIVAIPDHLRLVPAVIDSDSGALVTPMAPAMPGEYITIFAVGLGAVRGGVIAGVPAPLGADLTAADLVVQVGNANLTPSFAGLAPGQVGLYQINVRLPDGVRAGPTGLRLRVGEIASEPATLFIGRK